jgi:hypothetical protein
MQQFERYFVYRKLHLRQRWTHIQVIITSYAKVCSMYSGSVRFTISTTRWLCVSPARRDALWADRILHPLLQIQALRIPGLQADAPSRMHITFQPLFDTNYRRKVTEAGNGQPKSSGMKAHFECVCNAHGGHKFHSLQLG